MAVKVDEERTSAPVDVKEKSLADGLRMGRLSYKERFIIWCYEVVINKTATVETTANLLQEVAVAELELNDRGAESHETQKTLPSLRKRGAEAQYIQNFRAKMEKFTLLSRKIGGPGHPLPQLKLRPWEILH